MQKNTIITIVVSVLIITGAIYYVNTVEKNTTANQKETTSEPTANVEMRDGVQYITITAKNGYAPRMSSAKADTPTKLIIRTNGTYDCSTSLVIRQRSFHTILKPTGEEIIDVGAYGSGEKLYGSCSMGMYSFTVAFE